MRSAIRLACVLAPLAVVALAARARAASTGGIGPTNPVVIAPIPGRGYADGCPMWNASQCAYDPYAQSTCGQAHCGAVLSAALANGVKASTQPWGYVIPPKGSSGAGRLAYMPFFPFDTASMSAQVGAGDPVLNALVTSSVHVATTPNLSAIDPFEKDGTSIGSCDELVYKSFYDYARFEDGANSCGGNADCVYAVAAMTVVPGLDHTLHDDTIHPTAIPLLSRTEMNAHGATMSWDRNPFTREEMGVLLGGTATKLGLDPSIVSALKALDAYVQTRPPNVPWNFFDPYVVAQGQRMAWHKRMHDGQPSMTHAERRDIRQRIAAMAKAMDLVSYWDGKVIATSAQDAAEFEKECGPYYNNQESEPDFPCAIHTPCSKDGPMPAKCKNWPQTHASPMEKQFGQVAAAASKLLADEWNHVDPATGQIDHGCLAWGSTKCDWWPEMVVDDYVGLFVGERQHERAQCLNITEGYFQPSQVPPWATVDATMFKGWMAGLSDAIAKDRAELSWKGDAFNTLHYDLPGESFTLGDPKWVGASYGHGGAWELEVDRDPATHRVCRLSGTYSASIGASVSLAGYTEQIIDSDLALGVGRDGQGNPSNGVVFESHLTVRNNSLWSAGDPLANAGSAVDWTSTDVDGTVAEYEEEFPFAIVGIPIHIRVDVQVGLSADAKVHAVAPNACGAASQSYGAMTYALDGTFTPQLYASADARVAVGVPGFDVGVDGYLDLVRISLPMHAASSFTNDANGPVIHFGSSSHIHGDILDGDVSVFAEALFYKTSKELFHFQGPSFDAPGWSVARDYGVPMFGVFSGGAPLPSSGGAQ